MIDINKLIQYAKSDTITSDGVKTLIYSRFLCGTISSTSLAGVKIFFKSIPFVVLGVLSSYKTFVSSRNLLILNKFLELNCACSPICIKSESNVRYIFLVSYC